MKKTTAAKEKEQTSTEGKSILQLGGPFIILCVLVIILGAILQYYLVIAGPNAMRHQQFVDSTLDSYAELALARVKAQARAIQSSLLPEEVNSVIESGDADVQQQWLAGVARRIDGQKGLRLITKEMLEVEPDATPPITNVVLDMIRRARAGELPSPELVQHHNQSLLILAIPVKIGAQQAPVLLVAKDPAMLQSALEDIKTLPGYLELQQAFGSNVVVLARYGDANAKVAEPAAVSSPRGSSWRVAYWPEDPASFGSERDLTIYFATVALVLLVIGLGGAWMLRNLQQTLKDDAGSLIKLITEGKGTRLRLPSHPFQLALFNDIAVTLARLLPANAPAPSGATAAQTHRPESGSPRESVDSEPRESLIAALGKSEDALEVSESTSLTELPAHIFRAYDIRGVVDSELSEAVVYEIGRSIGSEAYERGEQKVVVARDGRLSGPRLLAALKRGLMASGRDVIDIGEVPTPLLYFATHYFDSRSGVMLTGSHNPPEYNGLKIVLAGETLSGDDIQRLRERIETNDLLSGHGSEESASIMQDYIGQISGDIVLAQPLKVVVDCGNGVTGHVVPELLNTLGCEVIELYTEVDGNFPNHHPDPSKPDNLKDLIAKVAQEQADLGLAFDGDGDRLGVIDSEGNIIWPDRQMMLYSMDVLSRHPGADIIFDVKCSRNLAKIISAHGGRPIMWKTGHSLIKAKMRETGALLAGECSGHIFFKERWYGFDDALYTAARLMEILAADIRKSTEVFATLPDSIATPELNLSIADDKKFAFVERLANEGDFPGGDVKTIDGIRVDYDDGWGLVRASNTTPCLVIRFEAEDNAGLERIQQQFRQQMLSLDPSLKLPF